MAERMDSTTMSVVVVERASGGRARLRAVEASDTLLVYQYARYQMWRSDAEPAALETFAAVGLTLGPSSAGILVYQDIS
jgi:hypothetical protein